MARMFLNSQKALLIGALLVFIIPSSGRTEVKNAAPQPLGKLVDVGGYRVHLYCIGTGSPTVVITGAGYSFDWGLVQPEVGRFTRVCTYDHSGVAWSDSGPTDTCALRVREIHLALSNSNIEGPYVLVGHSLGALVSRLYGSEFSDEVAGMVIVDHALTVVTSLTPLPSGRLYFGGSPNLPAPQDPLALQRIRLRRFLIRDFKSCLPRIMNSIYGEIRYRDMRR
jgi:pimeloyl-ACP methyl ester carboxylesterase